MERNDGEDDHDYDHEILVWKSQEVNYEVRSAELKSQESRQKMKEVVYKKSGFPFLVNALHTLHLYFVLPLLIVLLIFHHLIILNKMSSA